jgi:hypothetical protein
MSPLYRGAIEHGSVINVIPTTDINARRARGELPPNFELKRTGTTTQSTGETSQKGAPAKFPDYNQVKDKLKKQKFWTG